jgi:atlastin
MVFASNSSSPQNLNSKTNFRQNTEFQKQKVPNLKMGESTVLQIISIDTQDENYNFNLHEDNLKRVTDQISHEQEIVVISVVGACRSGKSFFLSLVLRYFTYLSQTGVTPNPKWFDEVNGLQEDVFDWKGGSDAVTRGLRMWSKPFFIKNKAILLIDTQGLFDNQI